MNEETLVVSKPAWASKGVIGSAVVIIVSAVSVVGLFVPALRDVKIDPSKLAGYLTSLTTLVFGALALYGRIKADSPIHFINRKTVPGGPFNPNAPVKKALPVRPPRGCVLSTPAAWACWLALAAAIILFLVFVPARAQSVPPPRYPNIIEELEHPLPQNLSGPWLRVVPVEDRRPFLVRLWHSLAWSFNGKITRDAETGALHAEVTRATLKGGAEW